jgi:carbon storage regulator
MLVLRRKAGEAIVLDSAITIRVLGVEGDRVKLGIDAPPDVIVVREELLRDAGATLPIPQFRMTSGGDPHA